MTSAQTKVVWLPQYGLDLPEIDEQHKFLLQLINAVWIAVINKSDRDDTLHLISELEKYTVTHFAAEEDFMRDQGYSRFDGHREEHKTFIARIAQEKAAVVAGRRLSLELLHFLRDWLVQHIRFSDRAYADEFRQQRKATAPGALGKFFQRFMG